MKNYIPIIFISNPLNDTCIELKADEHGRNFSAIRIVKINNLCKIGKGK